MKKTNVATMLKTLKINQKILMMPFIAAISFTVVVIVLLILNGHNKSLTSTIQNEYYSLLEKSREFEIEFLKIQRGFQDAVALADLSEFKRLDDLRYRLLENMQETVSAYDKSQTSFVPIMQQFDDYYLMARDVSKKMIIGEADEDLVEELELMTSKYNLLKTSFADNTKAYKTRIAEAFEDKKRTYHYSIIFIVITTILTLTILSIISFRLTRSIIRPLDDVVSVASQVGAGNFDVDIKITESDEIGILQSSFRKMIGDINQLIRVKDKAFNQLNIVNKELTQEIAEREKAQNELNKHRDHLEELVYERTKELEDINKKLGNEIVQRKKAEQEQKQLLKDIESINDDLKNFAYIVSHDLKAPLRAIGSLADWLATDYEEKLDDQGKELIELLVSRVKRMHNLIEGILQYSRVGRIDEQRVEVDLNHIIKDVLELLSPPSTIDIKVDTKLPVIKAGKTRIQQVFQNLISNAVKYMDKPEGKVNIGSERENGSVKIYISDNGPGIEEKYHDKIFKIFQTLNPRDEYESTGVGLTLVKKITELYGGSIHIKSELNKGSTFTIVFPEKILV